MQQPQSFLSCLNMMLPTAIMLLLSGDLSCGEMSDVEHCKLYGKTGRGDFGIQAISESNTNC